jgi:predicted HTH domain antitoxin
MEKNDSSFNVVRRFLDTGLRERRVQKALDKYGQASITLPRAAEIAGTNIYEMIALLEEHGMPYRYDISDLEEYVKRRHG